MTQKRICLLVGGPHDGTRVSIEEGRFTWVLSEVVGAVDGRPDYVKHLYRAQFLRDGEREHRVFFHSSIQENFLLTLIHGYRAAGG